MTTIVKDIWAVYANRSPLGKMVVAAAMGISSLSTAFMGVVVYDVAINPDLRAPAPASAPEPVLEAAPDAETETEEDQPDDSTIIIPPRNLPLLPAQERKLMV